MIRLLPLLSAQELQVAPGFIADQKNPSGAPEALNQLEIINEHYGIPDPKTGKGISDYSDA